MSDNIKAILFAAVLSFICCILVTAASVGLKKYQVANAELDRQTNIVQSVGLIEPETDYSGQQINELYQNNITKAWIDISGKIILDQQPDNAEALKELYLFNQNETLAAIILPIHIRGLWGKIFGYISINQDGETVTGFTVVNHSETPGLGGEIEQPWFRNNFQGKKIFNDSGNIVSISVAKGKAEDTVSDQMLPHYVDGISGATLTGNFLTSGLKETLKDYEAILRKLKSNGKLL